MMSDISCVMSAEKAKLSVSLSTGADFVAGAIGSQSMGAILESTAAAAVLHSAAEGAVSALEEFGSFAVNIVLLGLNRLRAKKGMWSCTLVLLCPKILNILEPINATHKRNRIGHQIK